MAIFPQMPQYNITEGNLEVKLPTIWIDGKAEVKRVREEKRREEKRREEKRRGEERRGEERRGEKKREEEGRRGKKREDQRRERIRRKNQKKEDAGAGKGRKVATHCVFSSDLFLRRVEK